MELSNEFEVPVPIDEAWAVLTDVEGIAPCLPGAQLQEIVTDGDGNQAFNGTVKVKVGPISAQYKGTARFVKRDDDGYTAVLSASGRDTRGQGNANAIITATLRPNGDAATAVSVVTELALTGKVAQFGRGVLADVSKKLLDQFVENLESSVLRTGGSAGAEVPSVATSKAESTPTRPDEGESSIGGPSVRQVDAPDAAAVDLLDAAGSSVAKRLLPLLGVAVAALIVLRLLRNRGRG